MYRLLRAVLAMALLSGIPAFAQVPVPEITFDSATDFLKLPDNIYLGEAAGVATNSKGDIFVFTRTGHPTLTLGTARPFAHGGTRLFQFNQSGQFVREIGQDSYGFMVGQQVRIDSQDNIWTVDQMTNMVIKFSPVGRVLMLLGRKSESENFPGVIPTGAGGATGAGAQSDIFNKPTDVAWDAAGNIYVSDGNGNARIAKFDKDGKFIKSWGSRGSDPGQFNAPHGIALDLQGNVYVADRGNNRIQVFDSDGNFKTQFTNVGSPAALCISPGPHQYLYTSNSNPPNDIDVAGEIYKMDLDGKVLGKFGRAGKMVKEFGDVNAMDCRNGNDFYVAELINWRVQKLTLHPK
jgi:DNA-binding beta-propeller fold protein YncE